MNKLAAQLPPMLTGDELIEALKVAPIKASEPMSKSERLISLMEVYKLYIPLSSTVEVYNRLYLAVLSSLEKKGTLEETRLLNDNYRATKRLQRHGIIGGLDSFRLTGNPGVGKTSAVQRCIEVITHEKTIMTKKPFREIIPILEVETVSDCSIKNLLYSILIKVDETIGTQYFKANMSQQITTDVLMAAVSNVLTNHVALLCIDEIERVVENKKGITLLNFLTQLINQSNVSICFIGTETSNQFFEMKEYLARRTLGISLKRMDFDAVFYRFCSTLFSYQYTVGKVEFNGKYASWMYDHSGGLPSMVIALFIEGQRKAIASDKDKMSVAELDEAYKEVFATMAPFLERRERKLYAPQIRDALPDSDRKGDHVEEVFKKVSQIAFKDTAKAIQMLKSHVVVEFI